MTRLVDEGLVAEDWADNEHDGIVADSVASLEQEETVHKAGAALAAVAAARAGRPVGGAS